MPYTPREHLEYCQVFLLLVRARASDPSIARHAESATPISSLPLPLSFVSRLGFRERERENVASRSKSRGYRAAKSIAGGNANVLLLEHVEIHRAHGLVVAFPSGIYSKHTVAAPRVADFAKY